MKRVLFGILGSLVVAGTPLLAADRLTDRDVKALVGRIEQDRDRFDDALDGTLKRSIVRGPAGEVNVKRFLDDFQENIDRLEERLKPDYAASAEAETLLRQGSSIDRFFRQQPAGTKGESEWNRLAADLKTLAVAYGADFPLADGATVRRVGDRELATAVDGIARSAQQLKRSLENDLKKDPAVDKAAREAIVDEADQLAKDAKSLRKRVEDGKPSSAEAEGVMQRAAKLQAFIDGHHTAAASADWAAMSPQMQMLANAYGTPPLATSR
jgi:hypothetical protein